MASPTPNKGYTYPAHGGDVNSWDAPLNTNFDTIDKNLGGSITVALTSGTTVLSVADAQNAIYILTGALTGNCVVQWPAVGSTYVVENNTTNSFTVTLQTAGLGNSVVIPQGATLEIYSDGNNMKTAVNATDGDWDVPGDLNVDGVITTPEIDVNEVKAVNGYFLNAIPLVLGHGQCVFQYTSATSCTLLPRNGNTLAFPSGLVMQIPAAGITLSNGGLSNGVLYYVYALIGGTLVASTTGHTTDTTTGIEIQSGDTTRVLVGMVYLSGGSFLDAANNRLVASWFNRKPRQGRAIFTTNRTTTSTTLVEINSEIRVGFLTWGDAITVGYAGPVSNAANGGQTTTQIGIDGIVTLGAYAATLLSDNGNETQAGIHDVQALAEGFHYFTIAGKVNGSTGTWSANSALSATIIT